MLQRVDADTFQAEAGSTVTIVADSDDGAPSAAFRYNNKPLQTSQTQGKPSCTFIVVEGVKMFSWVVVFGQGDAPRYDLFELDDNGALADLDEPTTPDTTGESAQFRLRGLAAAQLEAAPTFAAAPPERKKAKGARKKSKKTAKPKKTAKKKTSKKKKTTGGRRR